jgi:hypothetical protein
MSTTTPNLTLTLYDSTTDQVVTFATFRAVWGGTATTSNFYRIDTWAGTVNSSISTLQNQRGAITVSAAYISANYYEATVSSISAYTTNMNILLKLDTDSNGTVTLNINSLGTKSVTKVNSSGTIVNITGAELQSGRYYLFTYDGTQWVWVNATSADQIYHGGTSGNVVLVASDGAISDSSTPATVVGGAIYNATAKTTLADADTVGITDSAASNVLKKITWANFKTAIGTALGAIINALTAKTTPVGADTIVIGDSASTYASKQVLLSNLYKALGTGTPSASTALLGDGSWGNVSGSNYYSLLSNGKFVVTVSSNNLTVAIKTLSGSDPSSGSPVGVIIGGNNVSITSALSVTANAATNWAGRGGSKFATIEQDWYVYLGYNATDGVTVGFSPIPYATLYSDFSTTSTAETYCKISTITNATSSDPYVNIGKFGATLSAGAGYTWTVPTFTNSNITYFPTPYSRVLTYVPTLTNVTAGNGTLTGRYYRTGRRVDYDITFVLGSTSSVSGPVTMDLPTTPASHGSTYLTSGTAIIRDTGTALFNGITPLTSGSSVVLYVFNASGTYGVQTATSSTVPMTWTNTDEFSVSGFYIE